MRKITADKIYTISDGVLDKHVLIVNDDGMIKDITARSEHDKSTLETYEGVLVPGFVNTHCHLELSHLKGLVPTGTGLIPFIKNVVQHRAAKEEAIQAAIEKADREMYEAGIVAVGDISNKADTVATKAKSKIHYHTFVEMFDFMVEAQAQTRFEEYFEVSKAYEGQSYSLVPHAPYSVSKKLFQLLQKHQIETDASVSIHNQETPHENAFFQSKSGDLIAFYEGFEMPISDQLPTKKSSIHYALAHMDANRRTLFVHNTMTTVADIQAAQKWNEQVYWASCPNANLYIENRLPRYEYFLETDAKVTIGTDSLTSNWQLSVLEEIKTIARYQSFVPTATLLRWATLNGAEVLGLADQFGSFELGKKPGVNLLSDNKLTAETQVKRIV